MSDGVITPPDGVDVSGAEYVFIAPGIYDREESGVYPFTTLLEIQEVDSVFDAKQQPFPSKTSSNYVSVAYVALVLMNGVYTLYSLSAEASEYDVKCTPYFILAQ